MMMRTSLRKRISIGKIKHDQVIFMHINKTKLSKVIHIVQIELSKVIFMIIVRIKIKLNRVLSMHIVRAKIKLSKVLFMQIKNRHIKSLLMKLNPRVEIEAEITILT